jgi:hypothetical protein
MTTNSNLPGCPSRSDCLIHSTLLHNLAALTRVIFPFFSIQLAINENGIDRAGVENIRTEATDHRLPIPSPRDRNGRLSTNDFNRSGNRNRCERPASLKRVPKFSQPEFRLRPKCDRSETAATNQAVFAKDFDRGCNTDRFQ